MSQQQRGKAKVRIGVVVSDKMDQTRVVAVHWSRPHPVYTRRVRRVTKFKAHDGANASHAGDTVRIVETRPLSKDKRWRIVEVVAKGERVELQPEEVGQAVLEEFSGKKEEAAVAVEEAPSAQAKPAEEAKQ
jgi:small subunit ribosomal protein S17